jgi:hypothetical protein
LELIKSGVQKLVTLLIFAMDAEPFLQRSRGYAELALRDNVKDYVAEIVGRDLSIAHRPRYSTKEIS